ncbi:MAG: MipA/OmpV family protein [Planctomycetes bacterium]|nr:MipA/OmpV family protein [Planctomycetota bacterium]
MLTGAAGEEGGEGWHRQGEWSLGAGAAIATMPYKSYDTRVLPLPLVSYRFDRYYIKGLGAGANLVKTENHDLSLGISYFALQFKPSKTDARELKPLDKRRSTIMAEISYTYTSPIGLVTAKLSQDILGHSNGMVGDLALKIPVIRTECFVLLPGFGAEWASTKQNDYYYGVSHKEAARGGAGYYRAKNSVSPYLSLEAKYSVTNRLSLFSAARLTFLGKHIKDSPMVGKSCTAAVAVGFQIGF